MTTIFPLNFSKKVNSILKLNISEAGTLKQQPKKKKKKKKKSPKFVQLGLDIGIYCDVILQVRFHSLLLTLLVAQEQLGSDLSMHY